MLPKDTISIDNLKNTNLLFFFIKTAPIVANLVSDLAKNKFLLKFIFFPIRISFQH
ncbi:MAG: Unknown protein [uncultured Aureispira sp.]|uniref:Uncharacterized protein n=1 Tax=uncultured Aureispira sp. TaxID=1331704 RepID=A0A6S6SUW7_9BACT|nr:MAG: Unknown protein [uncultured Aureispira sp.]